MQEVLLLGNDVTQEVMLQSQSLRVYIIKVLVRPKVR